MTNPQTATIVNDFRTDLARAGKSAHTVRAYRGYRHGPLFRAEKNYVGHHHGRGDPHLAAPENPRAPEQLISHCFGRTPYGPYRFGGNGRPQRNRPGWPGTAWRLLASRVPGEQGNQNRS